MTPLLEHVPVGADPDAAYLGFVEWANSRGLTLYPAQDEAVIEIVSGANVILSTPTGTGKSLVAVAAHAASLSRGGRTYYTAPIKALVSEKFFALVDIFGAENVGMVTGDSSVNSDAPIICCTAEILANLALRQGADADVDQVVMDEFHYYGEADRGWAWQVPLLLLTRAQFILMSATLGDVTDIADDLSRRTGRPTARVTGVERPVPLHFEYARTPVHETVQELLDTKQAPIYVVHFSQAAAMERAQALSSIRIIGREQRDEIAEAIGGFRFTTGFGKTLSRYVRAGIGVHHAGMLPRYRRLVETLAQRGLLRVICGTDTLGVGINVPIRTVLMTALTKYDGTRMRQLSAREFHQIARARGPRRLRHRRDRRRHGARPRDRERRADPQGRRRPQEAEEDRAQEGAAGLRQLDRAELRSPRRRRARAARPADEALGRDAHQRHRARRRRVRQRPLARLRQPRAPRPPVRARAPRDRDLPHARAGRGGGGPAPARVARICRFRRCGSDDPGDSRIRLTVDLQPNFALNQPLSPFALAAIEMLDPEVELGRGPDAVPPASSVGTGHYALDVVSVIESTLDDPRPILSQQQFRARGEAVAAMKRDGIEYDERMELLEEITWPKPLDELLAQAYEVFASSQPWIRDFELSPKSVVRDMYERACSFGEYVSLYQLARSEGLVLRYLSDAFRAIRQTVPVDAQTPDLLDLIAWLGEVVRQVDSSLVDEWEQLINPADDPTAPVVPPAPPSILTNRRAFGVLVRNEMFRRVQLAALQRDDELVELDPDVDWPSALDSYFDEHDEIGTGGAARSSALVVIDESSASDGVWRVEQIIDDPAGDHDWRIRAEVDLAASEEEGTAIVRVTEVLRL